MAISEAFVRLLIRQRLPLFLLAVILAGAAVWPAVFQLEFDRSIENMFAADDPILVDYLRLKRTFGGNEVVLAVYQDEGLAAEDGVGLKRLARIADRLEKVEGVRAALSLDRVLRAVPDLTSDAPDRLVDRLQSKVGQGLADMFAGLTHSDNRQVASIVVMLEPESETDFPRGATIDQLRGIMADLPQPLEPGMIAGEPVMVVDGFRLVEEDGALLGWASTILLAIVLVLSFRSIRWVLIPVAVVQWTLLATRATLVWSGLELSMVSSMLTAIVTVVGVATVVHLIVRFRMARHAGQDRETALATAGAFLVAGIGWACVTDAVGFSSLLLADVGPVQDFGLMMAVGSLLVILATATLTPLLALAGEVDPDPQAAWGEDWLGWLLSACVRLVTAYPIPIGLAAAALAGLFIFGVTRLRVETDFTKNFRDGSQIVESYNFVEDNLGGAGVWDVMLPAPPQDELTIGYLLKVRQLQTRLRKELGATPENPRGLTKVVSLVDTVNAFGLPMPSLLPGLPAPIDRLKNLIGVDDPFFDAFLDSLYGQDPDTGRHYYRIMLRARERQPAEAKKKLIAEVERIVREEFPEAEVTGFFVLLTNIIDSLVRDQWLTFGAAAAGIAAVMLIAFALELAGAGLGPLLVLGRALLLAAIGLVPNATPILIVLGLLGWLDIPMNMGAAMIAAVSMGLSVDSSIHYIIAFIRSDEDGEEVDPLQTVQQSVGRAVSFSTLALIAGFAVLLTSQFVPTIYFGALVSLAMLGGLAGNLVVLPLLLRAVYPSAARKEKATTSP